MKNIIIISIAFFVLILSGCSSLGNNKDDHSMKNAAQYNVQLGSGYLSQGNYNLARLKLTKALEQDPDNALAHSTMALLLEKVGQHEDIIEHYEDAMNLAPDNSDINNNFGTYLCNQSRFDEAQIQFQKAISDPYYQTPIVALINAGKCAMDNSKFELAESYLRKALRTDSKSATALYYMAVLGLKSKKYLMTRAYIQRYHSISRYSPESLWLQIQAEQALGDKTVVKELIRKLIKAFPDSDEAGKVMGLLR